MQSNCKGLPQDLRPVAKKDKGKNVLCLEKTKKDFLINSGDSVALQKGQISVIAWLEKKHRKPVLIASTATDPASLPVTVSRKQNDGRITDVPCPQAVKKYIEKMGGVDRNDALCVEHSTARMARRWWL